MVNERWIGKDLERIGRGIIEALPLQLLSGAGENPRKPSVKIADILAAIRTQHLMNSSL
jgi:hypothetical protein